MQVLWLNLNFPLLIKLIIRDVFENRAHFVGCQMDSFLSFSGNPLDWLIISHSFNDRALIFVNSRDWLRFVDGLFPVSDVNLLDWNNLHFPSVLRDKDVADMGWILSMVKCPLSWVKPLLGVSLWWSCSRIFTFDEKLAPVGLGDISWCWSVQSWILFLFSIAYEVIEIGVVEWHRCWSHHSLLLVTFVVSVHKSRFNLLVSLYSLRSFHLRSIVFSHSHLFLEIRRFSLPHFILDLSITISLLEYFTLLVALVSLFLSPLLCLPSIIFQRISLWSFLLRHHFDFLYLLRNFLSRGLI